MTTEALSEFARAVLRKIADGRRSIPRADGSAHVAGRLVPSSVMSRLIARDLIRRTDSGYEATEAGRSHLRRKADIPAPRAGERLSPYRAQHMRLARPSCAEHGASRSALVNTGESPLGRLAARRGKDGAPLLTERQRLAGERFREDFQCACLLPRMTRLFDAPPISRASRGAPANPTPTDAMIEARRRVHRALDAVGAGLDDILIRVCCFLEGLEEAERTLDWPVRSGKVVLRIALDRLADHYDGKKAGARKRPLVQEMQ